LRGDASVVRDVSAPPREVEIAHHGVDRLRDDPA
jgi:hypothetical protein